MDFDNGGDIEGYDYDDDIDSNRDNNGQGVDLLDELGTDDDSMLTIMITCHMIVTTMLTQVKGLVSRLDELETELEGERNNRGKAEKSRWIPF